MSAERREPPVAAARAEPGVALSGEIVREIEAEAAHYPERRAACLEALKIVQRHHGWVSDERLHAVAALLDMSPAELDNVATFYNLVYRRPVGRHVILLCDSVSCWVMGQEGLRRRIRERLGIDPGETTPDGEYTLLPVACLGTCDQAPALMLDEALHRGLTPEALDRLLRERGGETA
jgi:NADH-quinone oxidoreductase subunit E